MGRTPAAPSWRHALSERTSSRTLGDATMIAAGGSTSTDAMTIVRVDQGFICLLRCVACGGNAIKRGNTARVYIVVRQDNPSSETRRGLDHTASAGRRRGTIRAQPSGTSMVHHRSSHL